MTTINRFYEIPTNFGCHAYVNIVYNAIYLVNVVIREEQNYILATGNLVSPNINDLKAQIIKRGMEEDIDFKMFGELLNHVEDILDDFAEFTARTKEDKFNIEFGVESRWMR